ncbi:hypothetical protein ACFQZS_00105 [Mucilaginibacter calamicampi]|uniref:Uncharacterized protein n=1 Tax=Mucilaginibacter calamicampi TaxID=1302352 RepID=A0ABW2YQ53_9SPHI
MKKIALLLVTVITVFNTYAQKLPTTQQISLRAPDDIKIDGKTTEWGKLQAYNPPTEINYTIANDDKKLYLVVQVSGGLITNIANGGIRLAIQKNGGRNDTGAPFIKYPYLEKAKRLPINPRDFNGAADTIVAKYNKQLTTNAKWIYTNGLNGVDSLLSVYNDRGVAAAGYFNSDMKYTLEMAVDLSLFGLSVENASKFSYHIIANAEPNKYSMAVYMDYIKNVFERNSQVFSLTREDSDRALENLRVADGRFNASTDFWGEYTLAK